MSTNSIMLYILMLGIVFIPVSAFAEFEYHYTEDKVKWNVVYLSYDSGCQNAYYDYLNVYDELTEKYLDLYEFEHHRQQAPECMSVFKYNEKYTVSPDVDLLILVLDDDLGYQELVSNGAGGFYYYDPATSDINSNYFQSESDKHIIVICDCRDKNFSEPAWLLSHELTHFILNYLGYPNEIADDKVHKDDLIYDNCIENISGSQYERECQDAIKTTINVNAFDFSVMVPYPNALEMKYYSTNSELNDLEKDLNHIQSWRDDGKIDGKTYGLLSLQLTDNYNTQQEKVPKILSEPLKGKLDISQYNKSIGEIYTNGVHIVNLVEKTNPSFEDSVFVSYVEIIPDLGITNFPIKNLRINPSHHVEYTVNSDVQCLEAIVDDGEFYVRCDGMLENVIINYNVS